MVKYTHKCAYPRCGKKLTTRNWSGVCNNHMHSYVCKCANCFRKRQGPRKLPPDHKAHMVRTQAMTDEVHIAKVTLTRAPWEKPNAEDSYA